LKDYRLIPTNLDGDFVCFDVGSDSKFNLTNQTLYKKISSPIFNRHRAELAKTTEINMDKFNKKLGKYGKLIWQEVPEKFKYLLKFCLKLREFNS